MSKLIKRPDYIQYCTAGIENNWYTEEDRIKLENEEALIEWSSPRAFMWKDGPIKHHLKALSILGIPLCLVLINYFSTLNDPNTSDVAGGLVLTITIFFTSIYALFYYVWRSQYHSIAFKITESGMLTDILKIYPKWRYGIQDPTKFVYFLRSVSVILIIVALFTDPLLLAGAAGTVFLSFIKPKVDKPEKADYIPIFWKTGLTDEDELRFIVFTSNRYIIHIYSKSLIYGMSLFCNKDNFTDVKNIVLKKLPNAEIFEAQYRSRPNSKKNRETHG